MIDVGFFTGYAFSDDLPSLFIKPLSKHKLKVV